MNVCHYVVVDFFIIYGTGTGTEDSTKQEQHLNKFGAFIDKNEKRGGKINYMELDESYSLRKKAH